MPTEHPKGREDLVPLDQLKAWTREWQERLRLQDWRVRVQYADDGNPNCGTLGAWISSSLPTKCACLSMSPARGISKGSEENEIVHELLHLHFEEIDSKWPRDSLEWKLFEAAIDSIAEGLIRAKYGEKFQDDYVA